MSFCLRHKVDNSNPVFSIHGSLSVTPYLRFSNYINGSNFEIQKTEIYKKMQYKHFFCESNIYH